MIDDEQARIISKKILDENKILYCMNKRSMTETCMCWGLEVPDVWLNEIDSMSKKLEAMNYLTYPKYHVRIQMDQVKDKYAELRAYYSIIVDPPSWICIYEKSIDMFMSLVNKLDFAYKYVVDNEPYDEIREEKIAADKVEKEKNAYKNISNVEIIELKDGTAIKKTTLHHYKKTHPEPTRFKFLHKLWQNRYSIKSFIRHFCGWVPSHKQMCISSYLEEYARNVIKDTTEKCTKICEKCGRYIDDNNEYSPRCITLGWVSYLCEDCAKESNQTYVKDGKSYINGKLIEKEKDI